MTHTAFAMLCLGVLLLGLYLADLYGTAQRIRNWRFRRQFFSAQKKQLENLSEWFDDTHGPVR